ncbi:hypothetical protein WDZ92_08975, partial [Nostoc sp. NIES-2111]
IILTPRNEEKKDLTPLEQFIAEKIDDDKEEEMEDRKYLPEATSNYFLNVPPGASVSVNLVGLNPLDSLSEDYQKMLSDENKLFNINIKLVGVTLGSDEIWSNDSPFSKNINKKDESMLNNLTK